MDRKPENAIRINPDRYNQLILQRSFLRRCSMFSLVRELPRIGIRRSGIKNCPVTTTTTSSSNKPWRKGNPKPKEYLK